VIQELIQASRLRAIAAAKARGTPLVVRFDARWSTGGFRGNEGTVTCIDATARSVLYVENLLKKGSKKNYEGSSKSMEGDGVKRIVARMKSDGLEIGAVIHDDDASTISNVWKVFPNTTEFLDINHVIKRVR